ncbi:MAG: glycosyltransferase family 39 protein [Arcicella sp.]|nr:glycosyltransferase family 39 protein [Arcicella sp.]
MTNFLNNLNLKKILFLGLFFRLLATIFSKGYAFTDDHFEVVELAQSILDKDFAKVFSFVPKGEAYVFNLIYVEVHTLIFWLCESFGMYNPEGKMFVARLIHALFSMITIYVGYRLTERLSNRPNDAKIVGLLLAIFWVFPFVSVRNLREVACIPPMMLGCYYACKIPPLKGAGGCTKQILLAAWWFVISFLFRYHIIFIPFIIGLWWLFDKRNWQKAILFGIALCTFYVLTQGLFDYFTWQNPFASLKTYTDFNTNSDNIAIYPNGPWHRYFGTLAGLFLGFPALLFLAGYFKTATQTGNRKMLFWGLLLFFAFHSYYPNKQERFMLPLLPLFIVLGTVGFRDIYEQYSNKKWLRGFTKFAVIWFVVLNTILVFILSVTYTKRSRVESMNYLREKGDLQNLLIQNYESAQLEAPFYLQKHYDYFVADTPEKLAEFPKEWISGKRIKPNYVILVGNTDLQKRIIEVKKVFPTMQHEVDIEPSFVDNIAYLMNPSHNHNETFYIFKVR